MFVKRKEPYHPNDISVHVKVIALTATFCLCNLASFCTISVRAIIRRRRLKRLQSDDWVLICAAILLLLVWWPSQIAYVYHSFAEFYAKPGSNYWNISPRWIFIMYNFYSFYFIISSMIKVALCTCQLHILPRSSEFKKTRWLIYCLITTISCTGVIMTVASILSCRPLLANFDPNVKVETCSVDWNFRLAWIPISVCFDVVILILPFNIMKKARLGNVERKTLKLVFGFNLIGTIACVASLWGALVTTRFKSDVAHPLYAAQMSFEIFMYTLGVTFMVLSPWLIKRGKETCREESGSRKVGSRSWFTARSKQSSVGDKHDFARYPGGSESQEGIIQMDSIAAKS